MASLKRVIDPEALEENSIPFARGDGDNLVLSTLDSHVFEGILGLLTMKESNALRGVCNEFREMVMAFPWMDAKTEIIGSLRVWRAAFPAAHAVKVLGWRRQSIVDPDFIHIRGDVCE